MPCRTINGINMRDEVISAVAGATVKAAPPVTVAAAIASGANLDVIVLLLTIVYLCVQIVYLGWRWLHDWRERRRADGRGGKRGGGLGSGRRQNGR